MLEIIRSIIKDIWIFIQYSIVIWYMIFPLIYLLSAKYKLKSYEENYNDNKFYYTIDFKIRKWDELVYLIHIIMVIYTLYLYFTINNVSGIWPICIIDFFLLLTCRGSSYYDKLIEQAKLDIKICEKWEEDEEYDDWFNSLSLSEQNIELWKQEQRRMHNEQLNAMNSQESAYRDYERATIRNTQAIEENNELRKKRN